jgi:plasmid stabilization system protein ParE
MAYQVIWRSGAVEDVLALFDYLAENSTVQEALSVTSRVLSSTDRLRDFPRLYEEAPQYGEGIRRIGVVGQNVLYEVNDSIQRVNVLAVVSQRQEYRFIR